jgi:uncharacterized membrane protein YqjE
MSQPQVIYSLPGRLLGLLEDHLHLAELEYGYEGEAGLRRLRLGALAVLFLLSAFVFLHLALLDVLVRFGAPRYAICSGFAVLWGAIGVWLFRVSGRRDIRVGEPFAGTRDEIRRSLKWTQNLFS